MWQTTVVWKFHLKWKYSTVTWTALKDLKESNPIEFAEYMTAKGIQDEPSLSWWVLFTICRRYRMIEYVNSRVRKSSHKYGIQIPTSIEEKKKIIRKNGTTY